MATDLPQPVLNQEETNNLEQLRLLLVNKSTSKQNQSNQILVKQNDQIHSLQSNRTLIRFLRATKGNIEEAAIRFTETQTWRIENNVSRWRLTAPGPIHSKSAITNFASHGYGALNNVEKYPDLRLVAPLPNRQEQYSYKKYVVSEHFGHDREGHPLYWERTGVGAGLFPLLCKDMTHDDIIRGHVRQQELALAKCEEASIKFNTYIGKQTVIMDMKGLSLWPRAGGISVFKRILQIDGRYYPETMAKHFIINAPWIFTGVWAMIKPWLDPTTANKIKVIGNNYQEILFEVIDPQQIPKEFGGTSEMQLDSALTIENQAEMKVDAMYLHTEEMNRRREELEGVGVVEMNGSDEMEGVGGVKMDGRDEMEGVGVVETMKKTKEYKPNVVHIKDVQADADNNKTISV